MTENVYSQHSICGKTDCVKSVQMRSFFWSVFSCICRNTGKYRPEKTPFFGYFSRSDLFKFGTALYQAFLSLNVNIGTI